MAWEPTVRYDNVLLIQWGFENVIAFADRLIGYTLSLSSHILCFIFEIAFSRKQADGAEP